MTWLSRNVLVLGMVSLLNDAASEMVAPLLPIFLVSTLGASVTAAGFVEGTADGLSAILKLAGGKISDRWGRYRLLLLGGYGLPAFVRPLLAMAGSAATVLFVRVLDRIGKGLRTAPRDALLAASCPPERRGTVFSFHRAMDHAGAVLGALAAWAFLEHVSPDLRALFWWSVVPGVLALLFVAGGVDDTGVAAMPVANGTARMPGRLRWVFGAVGLFGLGHAADSLLLLKASVERVPLAHLPLLWMLLHLVKVVTSLVAGPLADALGRRRVIAAGWVVFAAIYVGFAFAHDGVALAALFVAYGAYHGLAEGSEKALVAELVAPEMRGTAFGWYHLVSGAVAIPAGLLFGGLWTTFGPEAAFLAGAGLAVAALVPLGRSFRE